MVSWWIGDSVRWRGQYLRLLQLIYPLSSCPFIHCALNHTLPFTSYPPFIIIHGLLFWLETFAHWQTSLRLALVTLCSSNAIVHVALWPCGVCLCPTIKECSRAAGKKEDAWMNRIKSGEGARVVTGQRGRVDLVTLWSMQVTSDLCPLCLCMYCPLFPRSSARWWTFCLTRVPVVVIFIAFVSLTHSLSFSRFLLFPDCPLQHLSPLPPTTLMKERHGPDGRANGRVNRRMWWTTTNHNITTIQWWQGCNNINNNEHIANVSPRVHTEKERESFPIFPFLAPRSE